MTDKTIESVLNETRTFAPDPAFVKQATISGMDAYNRLCAEAAQAVVTRTRGRSSDAGAFPASIIHGVYHRHRFALIAPSSWAHDIGDKRGQSHRMGESYGAQGSNRVHDFPRVGLL